MRTEQTPPRLLLGIGIALVAYVFFVTASSLVWTFKGQFPTIQIVFIQNIVSLICISPLAMRFGIRRLKTKIFSIHLIRDGMGVLSYFLYFTAIRYLNLTDATTLNASSPFFVPFIWWIWVREKIDIHIWWSIIIGFIGVAVMLNPSAQIFEEGFLFGVCASIASATALTALRIVNLNKEPVSRTLFYYFFMASILTCPFAAVYWTTPTLFDWIRMIGIGVSTVLAQLLLTLAYRHGTATHLSPLSYLTVIYAAISSWIFFDTAPTLRSAVGTALVIIGGILTYVLKKKPQTLAETFEIPEPKERPPL